MKYTIKYRDWSTRATNGFCVAIYRFTTYTGATEEEVREKFLRLHAGKHHTLEAICEYEPETLSQYLGRKLLPRRI